jgi:ubiquinone/menaquinone biosynthesis C-methylase UbiE
MTTHLTIWAAKSGVSVMAESDSQMREEARETYQKGARFYDSMVWLYYAAGMHISLWRRKVVEALALRPGDTVVEIGCGTGLNFALLEQAIGSEGRIIGVDISEAMLERAKVRVAQPTTGFRKTWEVFLRPVS